MGYFFKKLCSWNNIFLVCFCNFFLAQTWASDWYFNTAGVGSLQAKNVKTGKLIAYPINGKDVLSLKEICLKLQCSLLYQWPQYRVVIKKKGESSSVVLSSLTHSFIADGRVYSFADNVEVSEKEGFLIPPEAAQKLAYSLKLGKILTKEEHEQENKGTSLSLKTIVIDPGHGGNDLGTKTGDLHEKDIALMYALKLKEELQKKLTGVEVLLTRDSDVYVSLPDRAKLANSKNANLFLSLHVNHAGSASIHGTESYILSPNATDDEARNTALLENETWFKSLNLDASSDIVKQIIADMETTKYIQSSALAASLVQQELAGLQKGHGLKNRGVKQAMFYVLSQVSMPSILLEMGFLSHSGDRDRMMNVVFQEAFIEKVAQAIQRYREKTSN